VKPAKNGLKPLRLAVFAGDVAAMVTTVAKSGEFLARNSPQMQLSSKRYFHIKYEKTIPQIEAGLVQQTVQIAARCAIAI